MGSGIEKKINLTTYRKKQHLKGGIHDKLARFKLIKLKQIPYKGLQLKAKFRYSVNLKAIAAFH